MSTYQRDLMMVKQTLTCVALCVLMNGLPAEAQILIVSTDKPTYTLQDTVRISIENPTDSWAYSGENPYWFLEHIETGLCLDGCGGVLDWVEFEPGSIREHTYRGLDILLYSGQLGDFRFGVYENGTGYGDQPPFPHATFTLIPFTPRESRTWSEVKSLYR